MADKPKATVHSLSALQKSVSNAAVGVSTIMVDIKPLMISKKRNVSLVAISFINSSPKQVVKPVLAISKSDGLTAILFTNSSPIVVNIPKLTIMKSSPLTVSFLANDSPTIDKRPVLT
jgi:hypothetical protein